MELATTVATQLYRVMAYKDEYEVARLLTSESFRRSIDLEFGEGVRLTYHLVPPTLGSNLAQRKRTFGQWFRMPMQLLGRMQWVRETPLDVFGRTHERKQERAWRDRYVTFVEALVTTPSAFDTAVASRIAELPANVRGFGHVKGQTLVTASERWDELAKSLTKR